MFKKVIIKVHFELNFNDTKNDSCDSLDNLDNMSVSLANMANLAFCYHFSTIGTLDNAKNNASVNDA